MVMKNASLSSKMCKALQIAFEGHYGQADKYGRPFIAHPIEVARFLDGERLQIVALLHDLCEDSPIWTLEKLRSEGFDETIICLLDILTKKSGASYTHYLRRIMESAEACAVKIADLTDNMDNRRITSNAKKYAIARRVLLRRLRTLDAKLFSQIIISQKLQDWEIELEIPSIKSRIIHHPCGAKKKRGKKTWNTFKKKRIEVLSTNRVKYGLIYR